MQFFCLFFLEGKTFMFMRSLDLTLAVSVNVNIMILSGVFFTFFIKDVFLFFHSSALSYNMILVK